MASTRGASVPVRPRLLEKALDVLEVLQSEPSGITLASISRRSGLPKATAYRIVATFEARGYLDRRPDARYRLSRKLSQFTGAGSLESVLVEAARPVMSQLLVSIGETLNLGVLDGGEVVVNETMESPRAVRMSSKIGNRRHLHTTALGKVLLAGIAEEEALRLVRLKGMPRLTPNTITDEESLLAELAKVRQRGWVIDTRRTNWTAAVSRRPHGQKRT